MRQIKKGFDPLVDKDAFLQRGTGKRTLICIPATLHNCIDEIRYRENTTLRSLVSKAMASYVYSEITHAPTAPDAALHFCTIDGERKVSTSITFNVEEFNTLRAVNHYWRVTYSQFVVDVLIRYLVQTYGETHPDVPGMDLLKNSMK